MTATTQPGVAQNVAPVQSAPADTVDQFQGLWDASVAAENAPAQTENERPDTENAATDAEAAGEPEQVPEQTAADDKSAKQPDKDAKEAPTEEKAYSSLDDYLKGENLDAEAFMGLPVTVKIDGQERAVPLAELVKNHQIASAGYERMQSLAREKETFQSEQQNVRQALGVRIQQVEALLKDAQDQLLGDYNAITPQQWQELRTTNPGEFAALQTQFGQRQQALQQRLQAVAQARQQETLADNQNRQQSLARERERLLQARPEWRDTAKATTAQQAMFAAGRQLGFTDAELQGVTDHRHLLALDLAARYVAQQAQLQAQLPKTLKVVRAAPKMAAPGTRQVRDPKAVALQNARKAWDANPRSEDAAAAVFEQFVN